ncbi:Hsp20/alpha crystallin family protein [Myxococcota bacterium]
MALTLWRPTRSLSPFNREVDRLFGTLFNSPFFEYQRTGLVPALDFIEGQDSYLVKVELPGVEEKDISITLVDGNLEIKGEKKEVKEEETELTYCSERRYGSFSRVVELPAGVDGEKTTAKFTNGILEIELPKKEEAKPKEVKIKVK